MSFPDSLIDAATRGDVATVLRWLDEGGDPNARNDSFDGSSVSLLDCAAFAGHATLVRELLARGADPRSTDVTGWSAMHAAASSESRVNPAAVVALLADAGANVNARVERRVEYDSDGEFYVVGVVLYSSRHASVHICAGVGK